MQIHECPHNQNEHCQIATQLAGLPVPIATDACQACLKQAFPCTVNRVTCSKAIQHRVAAGLPLVQQLLECVRPPDSGVGTELERLINNARDVLALVRLAWLIPQSSECGCGSMRSAMNYSTCAQCLQQRGFYVRNIARRWSELVPQVRVIPGKRLLISWYLGAAIRRAVKKQQKETR